MLVGCILRSHQVIKLWRYSLDSKYVWVPPAERHGSSGVNSPYEGLNRLHRGDSDSTDSPESTQTVLWLYRKN